MLHTFKKLASKSLIRNLLLVAVVSGLVFGVVRYRPEWFGLSRSAEGEREVQNLVEEVGRIIELPQGETPTVATVTDMEAVKDQQFFQNAQNGDKVLIYANAKKAFLYRPSERKIIEVGVVNINEQTQTLEREGIEIEEAEETSGTRFVLYNATDSSGSVSDFQERLTTSFPQAEVVGRGDAAGDYAGSFIVDLTGERPGQTRELAESFGIRVGNLPSEEARPANADFLIILAGDVVEEEATPTLTISPSPTQAPGQN